MPRFEWDPAKAAVNLRKHGVSFEMAVKAFSDLKAIELMDDDPDEPRFIQLGMSDGEVLFVVYAERRRAIRIISARKATKREQKAYLQQSQ